MRTPACRPTCRMAPAAALAHGMSPGAGSIHGSQRLAFRPAPRPNATLLP